MCIKSTYNNSNYNIIQRFQIFKNVKKRVRKKEGSKKCGKKEAKKRGRGGGERKVLKREGK